VEQEINKLDLLGFCCLIWSEERKSDKKAKALKQQSRVRGVEQERRTGRTKAKEIILQLKREVKRWKEEKFKLINTSR
jgi:hypothetical protein